MTNAAITDFDALLDASMDDLDDLPPVGVPPSGHYNLSVTATREQNKDKTSDYIKFSYEVEAINELKEPGTEGQAAVGMKFSENFSPIKKDGSTNDMGIGRLKAAVAPFSAHFGTPKIGETISQINKVSVAATLVRTVDRQEPDRFKFRLSDVVVL